MDEVLERLRADAAELGQRAIFGLNDEELQAGLASLTSIVGMIDRVRASLVHEADARGVPAKLGFPSSKVWLREAQRMLPATATMLTELGNTLNDHTMTAAALEAGRLSTDQARAIGRTVSALAVEGIAADVTHEAETLLLMQSEALGPAALTVAGDRVLSHVAPEIAESSLRRKLDNAERRARADRGLTLSIERDLQRTRMSGYLTAEGAAVVTAALEPLAKPRPAVDGVRDDRSAAARRADALVELCRVAGAQQAEASSDRHLAPPRLTVAVNYDVLAGELSCGLLDTGQMITPESVRRLACDASIIPAVLGSAGQVLDLGRSARVWSGPARHAILLRDRGCVFPGCDRPAAWCDIHHCTYFSEGGRTDRDNGALVCGFHHELIHHAGWRVQVASDGVPEVTPPPYIDPQQKPMRNPYHRRP